MVCSKMSFMHRTEQGKFKKETIASESFLTFIPDPLPPVPDLKLDGQTGRNLSRADQMLGRLDGLSRILPHPPCGMD